MLGTTSSGKSTFSKRLAERLGLAWVELDAFHFEPGWKEVPDEIFLARVHAALEADRWIVAGSYHIARDPIWTRADLAIWLDYPFWWIFWKLTTRTVKRWWTRELLWGTNYETLWVHFKLWSPDSLIHWLLITYWKRKREYPELLAQAQFKHIHLLRFQTPNETEAWLQSLPNKDILAQPTDPRAGHPADRRTSHDTQ